ncbi:proton-coupled amino acid transporter 4-like [Nilaparvata lugens]|uniref:proton-coupled amino acid transporter 4-like n=1 Tax=Nilaparvata lugens TaxID=108931 RepID=UPI00193CC409|nr:proton-coupled amino acid transporter 4-like [Nilaparvata lugens]XP_039287468.1 proton-coupled amino acid transporter 4-like [Nilaparvata lugens]
MERDEIKVNLNGDSYSTEKCMITHQSELPLLMSSENDGKLQKEEEGDDLHPGVKHPTSYVETLINLIKGNTGAGMFAMGDAFKNAGLLVGPILTVILGIICVYGNHILVNCSVAIREKKKMKKPLAFAETVQICFEEGPKFARPWANTVRICTYVFITITQLGFCSVYFVFISSTLVKILVPYGINIAAHTYMTMILLPILATALIRNLKFLTPISSLANLSLGSGVLLTLFFASRDLPPLATRRMAADWKQLPLFFGTTVYAFEGISLVLPLQNEMKNAKKFDTKFGVLNMGMTVVCAILISIGFVGYLKYGDDVKGSLTLNLEGTGLFSEIVQLNICFGILLSYTLQFYVPIKIIWPHVERKFAPMKHPVLCEKLFRTAFVIGTYFVALTVPHLGHFISLIGAVCGTTLALIFPPICDLVIRWPSDFGKLKWRLILDIFSLLVAAIGLVTGVYYSLEAIFDAYSNTT